MQRVSQSIVAWYRKIFNGKMPFEQRVSYVRSFRILRCILNSVDQFTSTLPKKQNQFISVILQ